MDGDVRMIMKFYNGNVIAEGIDRDWFLEQSLEVDCSDAPVLFEGEWPDRQDDSVVWCTYRPTERGIVAVVAVEE